MRIYLRLAEIARLKRGWTLRRLADELNMDYQNIVNWNTGRSIPHLAILISIARVLRCSVDELIAPETSKKPITGKPSASLLTNSSSFNSLKPIAPKRGRPPKKIPLTDPLGYSHPPQ